MTSLNDVNLKTKQVTAYSATAAGLAEMKTRFAVDLIPAEVTDENYPMVKEAATTLQKLRTGLDKKRKAIKAPYLEATKLIDGKAKELTEQISEIEEPWKAAKTEYDEREKRREEERQAKIEQVFTYLNQQQVSAYTMDSDSLAGLLEKLTAYDCADAMERVKEALELRNSIIDKAGELYAQKIDQERMEAENRHLQEQKWVDDAIAEYKGMVADYMDAGRQKLETQIDALELAELPDMGERTHEVVVARNKALAGLRKLLAMAPEEEPLATVNSAQEVHQHADGSQATPQIRKTLFSSGVSAELNQEQRLSDYQRGYVDGLQAFAYWKNGKQYVGTGGKTLKDAIRDFLEEPAVSNF